MPVARLGNFYFQADTTNFQQSTDRYRWSWKDRELLYGQDTLRNAGTKAPIKILTGKILHDFSEFGLSLDSVRLINNLYGNQSLEQLKRMGDAKIPYDYIDGLGRNMGKWVMEELNVTSQKYNQLGVPVEQDFTLQLKKDLEASKDTINTVLDFQVLEVTQDDFIVARSRETLRGISQIANRVEDFIIP